MHPDQGNPIANDAGCRIRALPIFQSGERYCRRPSRLQILMATLFSSALIATGLETALNQLLQLDPDVPPRLAELADEVIAIDLEGLGLSVYLQAVASGVRVLSGYDGEPTVRISGTPLALARHWRVTKSPVIP